jgi:hypothetical protein
MPYSVQAYCDDIVLTATADTAKEAFAKAVEWHVVERFTDVTISDGINTSSIAEFSTRMALLEIANTGELELRGRKQ